MATDAGPWWRRLLWFAALWLGGVAVLSVVALILRSIIL
jgi:hypothetical protein